MPDDPRLTAALRNAAENSERIDTGLAVINGRLDEISGKLAGIEQHLATETAPGPVRLLRLQDRIAAALDIASAAASTDGGHHKQWLIDQIVRALTGSGRDSGETAAYAAFTAASPDDWDIGIIP